jgi:hypothetical protein
MIKATSEEEHILAVLKPGMCTMTKRPKYEYTQELVDALGHEPTEEELVLIADGAHCVIKDRRFWGVVYND